MSPADALALPWFDKTLLRVVSKLVPDAGREDWSRTWQAELWHMHHGRRKSNLQISLDLSIGLFCDALWLRPDSWGRALNGTPELCLVSLAGLCLLATLFGLAVNGTLQAFAHYSRGPFERSLGAAVLVVFVSFATASRGYIEQGSASRGMRGLKRQIFFATKAALIVLLSIVLSADLCRPLYSSFPFWAATSQLLIFVPLALIGLRWAFADQEQRCKQCLHLLSGPERVGRPSHNLLEWNGTELACRHGHGLLSVPEMETSWCDSSRWVEVNSAWE